MFYILSKILGTFASPLTWILLLLLAAVLIKRTRPRLLMGALALLLILVFSSPGLQKRVFISWVGEYIAPFDTTMHYDYAIVLGGMSTYDTLNHVINFGDAVERVSEPARLYKKGCIDKIVVTNDGALFTDSVAFKQAMEDYFGVRQNDIMVEVEGLTTWESLAVAQRMWGDDYFKKARVLVVNSALVMRRTQLCCDKLGYDCDFYAVDYDFTTCALQGWEDYIPSVGTLASWDALGHELLGYIAYSLFK